MEKNPIADKERRLPGRYVKTNQGYLCATEMRTYHRPVEQTAGDGGEGSNAGHRSWMRGRVRWVEEPGPPGSALYRGSGHRSLAEERCRE